MSQEIEPADDLRADTLVAFSSPDYQVVHPGLRSGGDHPVTFHIIVDSTYRIQIANLGLINAAGKTYWQFKWEAAVIHPQVESYWGNVNPVGIRSCYDEGKRCAETLFFDYYRQHKLEIKVVRIFNTYGPNMHPEDGRVVSNFIMQALRGDDITVYGDGQQTRSFCYVDDMIDAFMLMMDTPAELTGPINLGNLKEFTILELAEKVIALTGSKSKIIYQPLPADDPKQRKPDITLGAKSIA